MNEGVTETRQAAAMLAVITDIARGARDSIRDWPLVVNAEQALREDGPDGLARYYHDCIDRPWVPGGLDQGNAPSTQQEDPGVGVSAIHGDLPVRVSGSDRTAMLMRQGVR